MKIASGKKWIMAVIAVLMVCVCAFASAQSYSLGDEDVEIETIQTALKKLKLYSGDITGHYGEKTMNAVKTFQKRNALEDDGIAGEDTLQALYESAGISASENTVSGDVSYTGAGTLRHGSRSEAVRQMQQDLKDLGYYTGSITGNFGTLTEAAVMKFQRANNLSADGIAGAKTLAKIADKMGGSSSNNSSSDNASSDSSNSASGSTSASSTLRYGVKSDAVRKMQQNLKDLGYYTGSVTGNFGKLTEEAVYNFQRANNLSADGIAGAKTLNKIASEMSGASSGSTSSGSSSSGSASSGSTQLNTSATLMKNSSGDEVRKLQKMLASLGYYSGNQTGNFGDKTRDAVVAFQKKMGLAADGIAGKRTLAAINAQYKKGTTSSGSSGSGSGSSSSDVLYQNFYNWRRDYNNGEYCTVYDPATGYSWTLRIMTKDAHMDAEPATAEDTAIMNKAFGGQVTWTPKPVWVTFADGKTFIGSTHNVPHTPYHLKDNNFDGHLCVHFPISMEKANEIGPYATSHQETINEAWEKLLAKFR